MLLQHITGPSHPQRNKVRKDSVTPPLTDALRGKNSVFFFVLRCLFVFCISEIDVNMEHLWVLDW